MAPVVTCTGVQPSHGSSLADLLSQHGLVKVQLNAACEGPDAAGAQLAEAAGTSVRCAGKNFVHCTVYESQQHGKSRLGAPR